MPHFRLFFMRKASALVIRSRLILIKILDFTRNKHIVQHGNR